MGKILFLVLLIWGLSVSFIHTANYLEPKGIQYCTLCHKKSHMFRAHVLNREPERIKSIISEYFRKSKKHYGMNNYFKMIEDFIARDLNFLVSLPKSICDFETLSLDTFRRLLTSYRDIWNSSLINTKPFLKAMKEAIPKITNPSTRKSVYKILNDEIVCWKPTASYGTRRKGCLLCSGLPLKKHLFLDHVRYPDSFGPIYDVAANFFKRYEKSTYKLGFKIYANGVGLSF